MKKILVFDKGGREERRKLINLKLAPRDFFQSIDLLKENGFNIKHLSSTKTNKNNLINIFLKPFQEALCRISNIGIRPLSVYKFRNTIRKSDYVISLTDGFSISLGFYYYFFDKNSDIKIAGAFHKLSDYDSKLPNFLKNFYYSIFLRILKRLDFIIFYGEADRDNSIKNFCIKKEKTHIIKFGVDTEFWKPIKKLAFNSDFIFSIGQDPSRDFKTLLEVKTNKKIHIHTSLLKKREHKKIKITNGSYHKYKDSLSDIEIRELYQNSFAVIVPLKDVYQPSGYSVTLQALACGKPVILTLTKGLWAPKIFKDKQNCILVNPYQKNEIEEALTFLEKNKIIYEKISKNARSTALNFFSLNTAYQSTMDLFNNFN